jgi:hypothetical protein
MPIFKQLKYKKRAITERLETKKKKKKNKIKKKKKKKKTSKFYPTYFLLPSSLLNSALSFLLPNN